MIDMGGNWRIFSGTCDTYKVDYLPVSRKVNSYFEETCRAAELVYEKNPGRINVCYSGGLDSEFILHTFLHLGLPITPVILKTQYNAHDISYATQFCDAKNLKYTLLELDFDKFVQSGKLLEICVDAKTGPGNAVLLWLYTQIDGSVLTGEGDQILFRNKDNPQWYIYEDENDTRIIDFRRKHNIEGPPQFQSSYTCEQTLSYLLDPVVVDLVNNRIPGKLSNVSSKARIYSNSSGFNFQVRPKFHGFEKTQQSEIWQHPDIQYAISMEDKWNGNYAIPYEQAVAKLNLHQHN
jgi:hypothetical protein